MDNRTCITVDCKSAVHIKSRGLCRRCYAHWYASVGRAEIAAGGGSYMRRRPRCDVENCSMPQFSKGYCRKHYDQVINYGYAPYVPEKVVECRWCSKEFTTTKSFAYCSDGCRRQRDIKRHRDSWLKRSAELKARLATVVLTCGECDVEFRPPDLRGARKYCSSKCSKKAQNKRQAERDKLVPCKADGCTNQRKCRGYCSGCYKRIGIEKGWCKPEPSWNESRRANYQKRRALKSGATAEKIISQEVYDRDGWVCGICTEPVDPLLKWPDPFSASLDHVVPLSLGGTHTYDNVQCAHLRCNVSKGNRIAA